MTNRLYLDNNRLRLGVDLESGGSVCHVSLASSGSNVLNHFDHGRFIQQSYYGAPDGSLWGDKEWRWNPVQGGDYKGHPAKIREYSNTATTLYIKSVPKHWATGADVTNTVMEQWISLTNDVAHIRFAFTYAGEHTHKPRHQEMPAVFADFALPNLVFYQGKRPWTDDALTTVVPGWPNEEHTRTEEWAAYVDTRNWGIGIYTPGTSDMTCYRYGGDSGPTGSGCSYFAPVRTLSVAKGLRLEYNVHVTLGSVSDIRRRFYAIHSGNSEGRFEGTAK